MKKTVLMLFMMFGFMVLTALAASPARAGGCQSGATAPCAEDPVIKSCNVCHSLQIQAGNRNGTDRYITLNSSTYRHIVDPKQVDWTSTVNAMVGKGAAPADPAVTAAYLNANYCSTCTGVIISSPVVVNIKDVSATITWSTSLNGWEDGPADSVVFYGTSPTALSSQASDPTMTGAHAVTLTGLKASTKYYFQYQSTGADGKTVKYNFDTPFFRTTAPAGGGGGTTTATFAYVLNRDSNSISVVNVDKKLLQTTIFLNETPTGIVSSPDGKTVYVAAWHLDTTTSGGFVNDLLVIDTATNAIKNIVPIIDPLSSDHPVELAISPDGQYLFGLHWSGVLLTIPTSNLSVVKSTLVQQGSQLAKIAMASDGKTLYVVSGTGTAVPFSYKVDVASAINPAVSTIVTPIPMPTKDWYGISMPNGPGAMAVAAGGDGRAWIPGAPGLYSAFTMVKADGTTQVVSPYSGNGVALTPLGDAVFSTLQFGIQQLDTSTMKYAIAYPDPLFNYLYSGVAVTSDALTVLAAGSCVAAIACSDLLYILDSSTLAVNATVLIGSTTAPFTVSNGVQPHDLTLVKVTTGTPAAPPPTLIYSANGAANNVSVIDTATNTVTATIPVGVNPLAVAPTPDGKLVYVVNGDNSVSVITRSTQAVTATITLPDPITGSAAAIAGPGNNVVYVANHDAMKIYVINTTTNTITATIPAGQTLSGIVGSILGPVDLAITPDGGTLYANMDVQPSAQTNTDGYVAAIQTSNNSVVAKITLPVFNGWWGTYRSGGNHIAMNPLGGYAYVSANGTLVVLDTAANGVVTSSKPFDPTVNNNCYQVHTVAVTPDGATAAFSCWNAVTLFDTSTLQPIGNSGANIPNVIGSIAFNADGSKAYATSRESGSTIVNVVDMTTLGAPVAAITLPVMSGMVASSPAVRSIAGGTPISLTAPDLTITSLSASSPVNLSTFNNISITDTVANIGASKSGSFVINYYFSPTNTFNTATAVLIGSRSITGPFNAGATSTVTTTLTLSPTTIAAGNYYVVAYADANQQIAEANEANNKTPTAGTVQVIVADLVEAAVSSPAIGTTVNPGATISITDTVVNQGSAAVGSFSVGYFLIPTGGGRQNFLGIRTVSSLAAGASSTATVSLTIPTGAYGGTFYLRAVADYNNQILEPNKTNNIYTNMTGIITVTPPDLIITAVGFTPTSVTRPGMISVTFTVKNQGVSTAGPFFVGLYLSTDNVITTADRLINWYYVKSGLAAGASLSATVSMAIDTSVAAGTYYIGAYADYANAVVETNETNNGLAASGTLVVY